jgi:hypothetical protein
VVLGVIGAAAQAQAARADEFSDATSPKYLQGGATVFDAGVLTSSAGASGGPSGRGVALRGQMSVLDSPMLQGGLRTASLSSGLGRHKFRVGEARMAPVSSSYAARLSSGGLTTGTKRLLFKAFAKMNCVEYNQLQANSYSVEYNYRPIAFDQTLALPGFYGSSVQCFTDNNHLIAIDPRSLDTWVADARADVGMRSSWRKLIHVK